MTAVTYLMENAVHTYREFKQEPRQDARVHVLADTRRSAIPRREVWLYLNPDALASVKRGIAEAGRGETEFLGSFEQYADLDLDD